MLLPIRARIVSSFMISYWLRIIYVKLIENLVFKLDGSTKSQVQSRLK